MATADELLAGVSTVDKTLVISNDFRTINIPSSVPNLGVEYDDDVLRLDFKMPRYVSDTDLSKFAIRINYMNSKGESDAYTVSDKIVGSDYITFSWLVGPTATRYKGNTNFIVCAKIVKVDGTVDKEFNTTIATLPVLEGLEVDESIVTEYSDIIEQWRQELFGIGDTEESSIKTVSEAEQAAIENKGAEVLATIPVDYQTAVSMTDNADRTKADAIVCYVEDTNIRVDDSSDDYLRGLKVFGKTTQVVTTGKNLLNIPDSIPTTKGVTFTVNPDRSVVATGTPTEVFAVSLYGSYSEPLVFPAGTYIISGGVDENHYLRVRVHTADGTLKTMRYSNGADKEFTVEDGELISISIYLASLNGVNNMTFYPMVRDVTVTDNAYEPYSGGLASPRPDWSQELGNIEEFTLDVYGKNLAVQRYSVDTTTTGMHIFTTDNTSEVLLNGVAEKLFSHTVLRTGTLAPGIYTASVSGVNIHDDGHDRLYIADYYTGKIYANYLRDGSPKTITLTEPTRLRIDMVFKAGTEYTNRTLKIQVEAGSERTVYESCKAVQSIVLNRTLPGIPVSQNGNLIDLNGQQWTCDEIDFDRGVYVNRVGTKVFDGSTDEIWYKDSLILDNTIMFRIQIDDSVNVGNIVGKDYLCSNFPVKNMYNSDVEGTQHTMRQFYFRLNKSALATADLNGFREYLTAHPMTVHYVLDTPIETPLAAEEIEWFRFTHTNFPNTTVLNDAGAMMALKYNADTRLWLDNIPKVTDEQAGPLVEAWMNEHFTDAEGVVYGKSAYEIALERGFQGSEEYWLASLKGRDGKDGQNGKNGNDGNDGADGYTPVKGVDYYTDSEREELVADITENVTGELDDRVVAHGVTNGWTWRKWESGEAEYYGTFRKTFDGGSGDFILFYLNTPFDLLLDRGNEIECPVDIFSSFSNTSLNKIVHLNIITNLLEDHDLWDTQMLEVILVGRQGVDMPETDIDCAVSLLVKGRWK